MQHDVIVVGAGLVGGVLANALAAQGLRLVVVDSGSAPVVDPQHCDIRVSALGRAADNVLRNLGIWEEMPRQRVSPFRAMVVWDAGSVGAIRFDAAEIAQPYLGHIVENNALIDASHQVLSRFDTVTVLWRSRVQELVTSAHSVRIELSGGEAFTARVLVGADGAGSWVRRRLAIGSPRHDYAQRAIVAQVETEKPHQQTAWQRFLPTGPLAFLPLADGSSSIVWSCDRPTADELLELDDASFRARLASAFEHRLGDILRCGPPRSFPLSRSDAEAYIANRSALIGDAAHTVHPLAGQGANLGIADAVTLAEVLVDAANSGKDLGGRAVLRRYERWRKSENALMMYAMHGLQRLFSAPWGLVRGVRGLGLRVTDRSGPLKHAIIRRAMGLDGDLPRLARPNPAPPAESGP